MDIIILADCQYILCTILLTFITIFLLKFFFTKSPITSRNVPPSPPALPVIGHLHLLSFDHQAISFQSLAAKHGPLLHLRLGGARMLLVSSSSFASEIFKTQDLAFADRPEGAFSDELFYGNSGFFGAEYGKYWKFMKKLCMTQLFSPRQLERSRATRQTEIIKLCAYICDSAEKSEVVDMGLELMKMANNATCKMVMSTSCSESSGEAARIREMVVKTMKLASKVSYGDVLGPFKWFNRIIFWLYGSQLVDVSLKFDELFEVILNDHENRGNRDHRDDDDLVDLLLKVYEDDEAELKITRTQIKAFLLDLFVGGTFSSSETMQWAIAELINHPDVLNKAREEINSAIGNSCRLVDETDIPSLPYLQAVVKEALRLYPPVPVVIRKCRQNCKIKGYDIDQGMMVAINVYAVMRDPAVWDNPDEFRPERFLASSHDGQVSVEEQNFDYVAFGGGRRRCPGSTVALLLANTAVAAMVQCFDWKVGKNGDDDDAKIDVHIGAGMSLPMANPLNLRPVIHFNPFASTKVSI